MAVFSLQRTLQLPIGIDTAWEFFSNPGNLKKITPDYMGFDIKTPQEWLGPMYPGQIIAYTVRPLLGIPLFWLTEITQVRDRAFFVDEQRVGPYALWHHQHHFKEIPGGVEMTDLVHYRLPLGPLGRLANWLFVRRQLRHIFDYRTQVLVQHFGAYEKRLEQPVL